MLTAALLLAISAAPPVDLVYAQDVAACPDRKALAATVSGWLGYSPFAENASRAAHVRMFQDGDRLSGSLELFEGDKRVGSRAFTSVETNCRELAASVAQALLKAIDPRARDPRISAEESVGASVVDFEPTYFSVGVMGAVVSGLAPTPVNAGFGPELALRWRFLEFSLAGRFDLEAVQVSVFGDLSTQAFLASFSSCGLIPYVGFCLVASGGGLRVVGPDSVSMEPLFLPGARIMGRFEIFERFWLVPFVEALYVVLPVFVMKDRFDLWASSDFAVNAGLMIRYEVGARKAKPLARN